MCVPYFQVWNGVPWLTSFSYERRDINLEIPKGASNPLKISYTGTRFLICLLFSCVYVEAFHPSKQFSSHIKTFSYLPGLNQ